MTIVVTGASGHLGGAVVRALLGKGQRIRAVDIQHGSSLADLDVERVTASVLDPDALRGSLDGAEVVYHLAAIVSVTGDPDGRVWATNVDGVRNVAQAAIDARVRRLVHCSSVHAFDLERVRAIVDETSPRAEATHLPLYDRSKAAGESELRLAIRRGLDAVIVNPTGIIGPLDFGSSRMGQVFLGLRARKVPALVHGGFDWVDVRDVAAGMVAAEQRGRTGESYILSGHYHSMRELADLAAEVTGVPAPGFTIPLSVARLWGPFGTWLGRRTGSALVFSAESLHALQHGHPASHAKAKRELGFLPRSTRQTVRDLYTWFGEFRRSGNQS